MATHDAATTLVYYTDNGPKLVGEMSREELVAVLRETVRELERERQRHRDDLEFMSTLGREKQYQAYARGYDTAVVQLPPPEE